MTLVLLFSLGIGNAWGSSHDKHTATLNVAVGTGSGTVYASTSSTATSGDTSASFDCGGSESGTHKGTLYAYASPAGGYTFLGWTTSASSSDGADNANPKGVAFDVSSANSSQTLYAHFVEKAKVNITFEAPSNGTYTIKVNGGSAETVSSANVVKSNVEGVVLTATPASGYAFAGWYKLNSAGEFVEDLSIANPYDAAFTESETIKMGARFVPTTLGKFILKGSDTQYYGLKAATIAAGGSGTIVPVADETLVDGSDLMPFDNGTYSIKAGATLLVPYSSANTVQTAPQIITTAATLSAYKTLVFTDGVNVECDGTICVGGQIMAGSGGSMSSYVSGPCGMINMANGGHIELNSGAKLYCWGFIKGQDMDQGNNTVGVGTITANSDAEVWENLGIGDWRGGTATSNIKNTRFFPFQSYFIQNIEVPLTIEYGATEKNYIALNATGGPYNTSATTIGSSKALFLLKDANSTFRKWYDPTTDLTCFELSGTSQIDALAIKISALGLNIDVNSADFDLPINSSMHIILTNSSVTLSKPMVLQPGAVIEVKNDADITLSSNAYLYDKDNWGAYAGPSYYFHSYPNLTSHKNRGDGKSNALLDDAKVIVDGTVSVTGKLYSTAAGANVMGNGGGKIVFSTGLPTATTIPAFTSNGDAVSGGVAVNSANLCNEDESYTKSIASTTFHNVNGRWFKSGNQNENADHTYNFTYIASGAVSGTGGTDVSPNTHNAVYAPDKTGLTAGMKWCNVAQDATCTNIFNATQTLNETPASDIRYTYPTDSWLQLLKTETEGVYGGSDNSLYAVDGCAVNSLGSVDENCLYTINDVKKALVDGHFVALEKNTEDEAWHDVANPTNYYISFAGCTWHPATKYASEEKAYIVEDGNYIWYNNDWLLVEREDPFFFDYNDQNVKRYYEYEDGAWVLASPRVRVVDAIETRDFYKLPEAITVASGKKNTTITILKDISGINTRMTYTAKNTTCTLDLNGHTVSGAAPFGDDNNRGLLIINASGTTFTITDNSANKEGRLENICNQNKVTYTVHLMAGMLNVEHGTIHAENPAQYHSSNLASCGARGIHVAASSTLNISGGRVEAKATRNAFAVLEASSVANNTTVNITGGEIYAEAPYTAYGVYAYGKLNVSGNNTITVKINTDMVDAASAADHANNKKNGDGRGIYLNTSANKAQGSCYFSTLNYTGGTINVTNERTNNADLRAYGIFFDCANATTDNRGGATDGSSGQKTAAKGSVKNATININNGCQYGIGIYVTGSYNSYDKSTHVVKIENCNIDVKGYANNFGIWAQAGVNSTNGGCYHGDVQADNCTVRVESTGSTNAYGAWATAAATTIAHYKNPTTEAAGTEASKYYGEYASAAKLTINGGSYTAKTKSAGAYAVGTTGPRAISPYGSKYSDAAFRTEGGHAKDSATLIINGGIFNATSTTYTARGLSSGGITTVDNATFNVVAGSYYAYGLYASSGKLTATNVQVNDTAKGRVSSSDSNGYAYGAFADCAIPTGNTAQNGFGYAGEIELNNCTLNVVATTYLNAKGIMVNATSKLHNWTTFHADSLSNKWTTANYNYYKQVFPCTIQGKDSVWMGVAAKATVNNCAFTVKAHTTSAWGAYVSRALHYSYQKPNTILEQCPGVLNINNTSFEVSTDTKDTSEGIRTYGTVHISGNSSFTVNSATSTAIGLKIYAGTTTIDDNPTFDITAGSSSAYGAWVFADTPADKTGATYDGELIVNGGTFNVTTGTTTAYGVYVQAGARQITNTAAGYYPGTYASIGHATINDGTFNVTAGTTTAMGVYVGRAVTADNLQIFRGVADINGGTFKITTSANNKKANQCDGILTYGTTTINGGSFDVLCKNDATPANGVYAYGVYVLDGTTTINKNIDDETKPSFNVKAYGTVYSVLVSADVANATTGLTYNGNVIIDGGTYNDTTTTGNSAYGVCVSMPAPRVIASGDYAGTYYSTATATINDGTFNVYSAGTTAAGVFTGRTYTSANTKPNTFSNWKEGNTTINGGTFNTSATTTAVGVYTDGEAIVNGGDFYPTGRTSDAYGIYARAGSTTVNKTNNPSFTVKAPTIVYGALVGAQPSKDLGLPYDGELIVNGGEFDVQTTSGATAYGVFVNANKRKITSTSSGYYQGQYASAGHATINDGTFYVKAVGKTASGINMVATVSYAAEAAPYEAVSATPTCTVTGGKFKVFASSAASAVVSTPLAENMPIAGGYYNINTNLAKYAVSPKKVITLHQAHDLYPDPYGYRYTVNEGGTVTWKNGDATLKTEMYEKGETPSYSGDAPTKAEDASYTYSHSGWTPTIEEMANADKTYTATFNQTEQKYAVTVEAGENGKVSPASVSNIGCETASGDIKATPNAGYNFLGWTLPEGVTAASGYSATSNPIHIHATAADKTITANFVARNDIDYTVKHWQQNIENDEYTEVTADQQTLQGTTATATAAAAKSYAGFTAQPIGQVAIAGDGSTVVNIYYNRDTYTIKWVDGNGTTIETDEHVKYGATPSYDGETPTKTATAQYTYSFSGWDSEIVAVTEEKTYIAQFSSTPNPYTLTWDVNGGDDLTGDYTHGSTAYGTTIVKPADPTKTGYTFAGWTPSVAASMPAANTTYTATWTPSTNTAYTVKHYKEKLEGGYNAEPDETDNLTGTTGAEVTPAVKNYPGFTAPSTQTVTILADGSRVVTYQYTRNSHKVTWNATENGGSCATEFTMVKTGATIGTLPEATKTGHDFLGWFTTISGGGNQVTAATMITNKITFYARFAPQTYDITYKDQGNEDFSGVHGAGYPTTHTYGTATALVNPTKGGYTFNGWYDNAGCTGAALTEIGVAAYTDDFTLYAKWTASICTITWRNYNEDFLGTSTIQPGGTPGYSTVQHGVPTRDADGGKIYEWDGWTTEPNGAGTFYAKDELPAAAGDATYYAHFRIKSIEVEASDDIDIDEDTNVETTIVHVQGALNVAPSATLTTQDLILEATPGTSGEIIGTVEATEHAYFDLSNGTEGFNARTWYAVAVPWQVAVPAYDLPHCGVYITNDGEHYTQQELGSSFDVVYYDGALRAAQGPVNDCWRFVEDDASDVHIMYPGRAYMIYLTSDAQTIRFERKSDADLQTTTLAVDTWGIGNAKDMNWNGIANPATYHAYINANAGTYQGTANAGQIYHAESRSYSVVDLSQYDLVVGQPVFVQATAKNQSVAAISSHNVSAPYYAPRRSGNWTAPVTRYTVSLAADEAEASDRVIVCMDEDKEQDTYVIGQDLMKMGVSSVIPQLYINRYDGQMCVNTAAPVNNRTDYPLGIYVPQAGEYNLFINDQPNDETMLYLTLDGEIIWNLSYGGYVVNLDKGTTNRFGLRMIASAPQVTTGVEEALINAQGETRKVLINDKVFIIRGNNVYSADGQMVK